MVQTRATRKVDAAGAGVGGPRRSARLMEKPRLDYSETKRKAGPSLDDRPAKRTKAPVKTKAPPRTRVPQRRQPPLPPRPSSSSPPLSFSFSSSSSSPPSSALQSSSGLSSPPGTDELGSPPPGLPAVHPLEQLPSTTPPHHSATPPAHSATPPADPTAPLHHSPKPPAHSSPPPHHSPTPPPPAPSPQAPVAAPRTARQVNGLYNHQNACYFNATLQLLAAALDGYDLDALLGPVDPELERFGMKPETKSKSIRRAIKTAVRANNDAAISVARHFRAFLDQLGEEDDRNWISPFLFQQVVAHGWKPDEPHLHREILTGNTQEDAYLCFNTVLTTLVEDQFVGDADALWKIFELRYNEVLTCEVCEDVKIKEDTVTGLELRTARVLEEAVEEITLAQLVEERLNATEIVEVACDLDEKNHKTASRAEKFTKFSDRLLIAVNRVIHDKDNQQNLKNQMRILLGDLSLDIEGDHYRLLAAVFHKGPAVDHGHYTAFRRHKNRWYQVNDDIVREIADDKVLTTVADGKGSGHVAMLLYERVGEKPAESGKESDEGLEEAIAAAFEEESEEE